MKKITLIAALFATAFTGACGMLTKEQEELLIPLLDQRVQFVPVSPDVSPDAFADGQIYFMEDWAEWDTPDDRPVFYLGRGNTLTKVQIPYGYRVIPGVFSQDCTKYYAAVSEPDGFNFKLSVIDFLAGTITRLDTANVSYSITPSVTGAFGTYRIGNQFYKINTVNGTSSPFITSTGTSILWASYSGGYVGENADIYTIDPSTGAKTFVKTLPFNVNAFYTKDASGREYAMVSVIGTNDIRVSSNGTDWTTVLERASYMFLDSEQHVFITSSDAVTGGSETWYIKNDGTAAKYFPDKVSSHQIQNFCRKGIF